MAKGLAGAAPRLQSQFVWDVMTTVWAFARVTTFGGALIPPVPSRRLNTTDPDQHHLMAVRPARPRDGQAVSGDPLLRGGPVVAADDAAAPSRPPASGRRSGTPRLLNAEQWQRAGRGLRRMFGH